MCTATLYQVFSRQNDVNGNPYRLIMVYTVEEGKLKLHEAVQARSSRPNYVRELEHGGAQSLGEVYLAPYVYNSMVKDLGHTGAFLIREVD